MSRVDPLVRGELALQLLLGLLLGSLHLSISLQTAISAAPYSALVRTLILMLYPLALALTGLGALLVERWTALGGGRGLRGAGLLLLAFLGASLRLPLSGEWSRDLPLVATTTLLTLGGWYLLMGAVMAALNLLVALYTSTDVWLFYSTFADFVVSMGLILLVFQYAQGKIWRDAYPPYRQPEMAE